jgi:biopolymer transport protein ExbD
MAKREIQEINAGSMADIAFLLLIFFLVATTMDIDSGISRLLPPMPEEEEVDDDQEIRERNVFVVLINKDDDLFVEDGFYDVNELKEMTKEFFLNPEDADNLSEKRELVTDYFGTLMVSKGVISLRNDNSTSYGKYISVQNELAAAVNELRNELCMQKFGRKYDDLDPLNEVESDLISDAKKVFPMAISEAEPKNVGGN